MEDYSLCTKVTIIGLYLNPHFHHSLGSYQIILESLNSQRGMRKCALGINIHLKYDERYIQKNIKDWERKKNEVFEAYGHKLKVFFWDDSSTSLKIHDRFIITDQYGVSVGDGLNIHSSNIQKKSTWSILDNQAIVDTLDEYNENTSEYSLKYIV